jgi:heme-binding NEAT domain protein
MVEEGHTVTSQDLRISTLKSRWEERSTNSHQPTSQNGCTQEQVKKAVTHSPPKASEYPQATASKKRVLWRLQVRGKTVAHETQTISTLERRWQSQQPIICLKVLSSEN